MMKAHHVFFYKGKFVEVPEGGDIPGSVEMLTTTSRFRYVIPVLSYFPPELRSLTGRAMRLGWWGGRIAHPWDNEIGLLEIHFKRSKDARRWLRRAGEGIRRPMYQLYSVEALSNVDHP